jgi:ubiquinone/menaquinone biosynthesis C-methylase UbiE
MDTKRGEMIVAYNAFAGRYDETIGQLENYDSTYDYFISSLPKKGRVLDLACGSGVIARRIKKARPLLEIVGVDLSAEMLSIARNTVNGGLFIEADICTWKPPHRFDGIVVGFGLPYLDPAESVALISRYAKFLVPGGGFYVSYMQGTSEGYESVSFCPGQPLYLYYHDSTTITNAMIQAGIIPEKIWDLQYIESDESITIDTVIAGRKR